MRMNFDDGSGACDTRDHHKGARVPRSVQANLQTATAGVLGLYSRAYTSVSADFE